MKQHIAGKAQNRWPEKSFMIVMGHCGKAGVVFEHAWGDGAAVLHFMNSVNHHTTEIVKGEFAGPPLAADTLKPSSNGVLNEIEFKVSIDITGDSSTLNFKVDEKISEQIKKAIDFNDDVCDTLDMVICVAGDAPAVRNPWYYQQGLFQSI